MLDKQLIKRLHALAAASGMSVHSEDRSDDLHALIMAETGKSSTKELTLPEFRGLERRLLKLMQGMPKHPKQPRKPKAEKEPAPGMISSKQQSYAWRIIYEICELDPSPATAGERMCGAIEKILGITASPARPFAWVNAEQAATLITQLKRYLTSAERKAMRKGSAYGN